MMQCRLNPIEVLTDMVNEKYPNLVDVNIDFLPSSQMLDIVKKEISTMGKIAFCAKQKIPHSLPMKELIAKISDAITIKDARGLLIVCNEALPATQVLVSIMVQIVNLLDAAEMGEKTGHDMLRLLAEHYKEYHAKRLKQISRSLAQETPNKNVH